MPAGEFADLLMIFVISGKRMLEGTAQTKLIKNDQMTEGFDPGTMFEIDNFAFRTGMQGVDQETLLAQRSHDKLRGTMNRSMERAQREGDKQHARFCKDYMASMTPPGSSGEFDKWRKGEAANYPVDLAPIEFSRGVDGGSTLMLDHCIKRTTYERAALIKRKSAGGPAAGEVYLRLDFTGVLVTKIDWDDDVPVKEKCQFICRKVLVSYKPQLPNGELGAAKTATWPKQ